MLKRININFQIVSTLKKSKHCWCKFWPLCKEYCWTTRKVWVNIFISRAGQAAGVLVIYISPLFTSSELGTSSLWAARWDKRVVWWRFEGLMKARLDTKKDQYQWISGICLNSLGSSWPRTLNVKLQKTRQLRLLPVQWFVECVGIYKPLNGRQNKKTSRFLVIGN